MPHSTRHLFLALLLFILTFQKVAAANSYQVVAFTGQQAPEVDEARYNRLFAPTLNESGQVAFGATLENGADGLWAGNPSQLHLVVREGDPAPGTPAGVFFDRILAPILNDAGEVTFESTLQGPGVTNDDEDGIWTDAGGLLHLVARTGSVAPNSDGKVFDQFFIPSLNNSGETAFSAQLRGGDSSSDGGIWVERARKLELVTRQGIPAEAFPSGALIQVTAAHTLGDDREVAFAAFAQPGTGGVTSTDAHAVWSSRDGVQRLIAREGSPAPGTADNLLFDGFGSPRKAGNLLAFSASLRTNTEERFDGFGLWIERNGILELALSPSSALGIAEGTELFGITEFRLNRMGRLSFVGLLTGESVTSLNDSAVFSNTEGPWEIVVRGGDHAPGTPSGTTFRSLRDSRYAYNDKGQVAFLAELQGGDVNLPQGRGLPPVFVNDHGIWGQDRSGSLRLIVRAGDWIDVDEGPATDLRQISQLGFVGQYGIGLSGYHGLNKLGQVAFSAQFTDASSGVFFTDALSVPEPGTSIIVILAIAFLVVSRFRNLAGRLTLSTAKYQVKRTESYGS